MSRALVCAVLAAAAMQATADDAPKCEIRNVRISSPHLAVSRANPKADAIVHGQFKVEMSFARPTVKKPVVRLAALCEAGDALTLYNAFLDRPRTCEAMKSGDIMRAFKDSGVDIPTKEREAAYSDPARFTPYLNEVSKSIYATAIYGTADTGRGFFRLGRSPTPPKILIWRIEIWQNGALAAAWESSRNGLGQYALPADWHAWKKHPAKFKYVAAR